MNTIEAIKTRSSVRKFTDQPISDADVHAILDAGMAGPSAVNARPFSFIVVKDREMLNKMADMNGNAANPMRGAALGILVCGDLERAYQGAPDYWVIDGSIAVQNMILAAHDLGIGSVWLGTWPQQNKMDGQKALFHLPEHIIPHSLVAFGYPEVKAEKGRGFYEEDRVHFERW